VTGGLEKFFIRNARPIPFLAGRFELASRVRLSPSQDKLTVWSSPGSSRRKL
jgi:hypothetical protein